MNIEFRKEGNKIVMVMDTATVETIVEALGDGAYWLSDALYRDDGFPLQPYSDDQDIAACVSEYVELADYIEQEMARLHPAWRADTMLEADFVHAENCDMGLDCTCRDGDDRAEPWYGGAILCGCGWGRLSVPKGEVVHNCPVCGHVFIGCTEP